jgi:hypothetical protein
MATRGGGTRRPALPRSNVPVSRLPWVTTALILACSSSTSVDGWSPPPEAAIESAAEPVSSALEPIADPVVLAEPPRIASSTPEAASDDRPRPQRQWDHISARSTESCRARLEELGAKFQPLPEVTKPNARGCGIPQGIVLTQGPTGIRYSPAVSVDCSFALVLSEVERIIQEEAQTHLGSPIVRITHLGSYTCRGVVGRLRGWSGGISEHSFGNALDLATLQPKKGVIASVLHHYEPGVPEPRTKQGVFLRALRKRIRNELSIRALGPDFDASHRDHYHLDAGSPIWR